MTAVNALILRAPGTNCDFETQEVFRRVGATARRVHVNELLGAPQLLTESQILVIPGGFSYGDDIAAGKILANQLRLRLRDQLHDFHNADKLILGICNGFQVLIKSGLLPGWRDEETAPATLGHNDSGHYVDRWVTLNVSPGNCHFLKGIEQLEVPIAHGEGRFVCKDEATLTRLSDSGQAVLRYTNPADAHSNTLEILPYPFNPNGSQGNIAGITNHTGRVLGLMPHPERYVEATQHPQWTRRNGDEPEVTGLMVFKNAVAYFE